jgi:hypothetical protein
MDRHRCDNPLTRFATMGRMGVVRFFDRLPEMLYSAFCANG